MFRSTVQSAMNIWTHNNISLPLLKSFLPLQFNWVISE